MAFFSFSIFSSLFFLLSSSASACDRCRHHAQAAHSSAFSQLLPRGACGYGAMAMELNGGFLASGAPQIHSGGLGCGRCFQMRCKDAKVCSTGGVRVVLTDLYRNNRTDFLLNGPAFVGLARPGMAQELKRLGPVPIEYKRIPCDYKNKNLSILVEDQSKMPNNLVIKFLHQGGQTDILAVDVAQVGSSDWRLMSRVYGPVWSTSRAPAGPLQFRLVVTGGYDGKWVWADREVLPAKWRPGQPYDTGIQIADVARESCLECDTQDWK